MRKAAQSMASARLSMPFYLPLLTTKLIAYRKLLRSEEFGGIAGRIFNLAKLLFEVVFIHILKLNPQKGMLVSISGTDGSGKTAHARALVEVLQRCGLSTSLSLDKGRIPDRILVAGKAADQEVRRFRQSGRRHSQRRALREIHQPAARQVATHPVEDGQHRGFLHLLQSHAADEAAEETGCGL